MARDLLAGKRQPKDLLAGRSQVVSSVDSKPSRFGELIRSQRGLTPVGFIPTTKEEVIDIPKVLGRQIPGMRGQEVSPVNQGPMAFGLNVAGIKKTDDVIPAPKTSYGKAFEGSADAAQIISGGLEIASMLKRPVSSPTQRFGQLRKQTKTAQDLSHELLEGAEEARKTAGAMQGGYVDANAESPINAEKLKDIISRLPQALQDEILNHPNIQRVPGGGVDAVGMPIKNGGEISPTLKNAETIRGIIRGKVPASRWNPKLVDEIAKNSAEVGYNEFGNLMTDGRPELAQAMGDYAKVRGAEKQVAPMIRTRQGFTKTKPVMKMFDKGADGTASQAVEALAEHNPDILKTVDKIRRFGESARRKEALAKSAQRAILGGELGGGGVIVGTLIHKGLKKVFGHS